MTRLEAARAALTAAREALRAHLSPVMSRDHDKRDALCAAVDSAKAELDAAQDEHDAYDFSVEVMARRTGRGLDIRRCA